MSTKRPLVDLAALTAEAATPMAEAQQRAPQSPANTDKPPPEKPAAQEAPPSRPRTSKPLAFKVSPAFRKRFRQRAVNADLKLNELLFEALDAWEEKMGLKKYNYRKRDFSLSSSFPAGRRLSGRDRAGFFVEASRISGFFIPAFAKRYESSIALCSVGLPLSHHKLSHSFSR